MEASAPPRYAASPFHAVTNFREYLWFVGGTIVRPGLSALIVDPDQPSRDALRQILNDIDVGVLEADTIDQARALMKRGAHLAIIEVNLPAKPGDVLATEMDKAGITPVLTSASTYGLARAKRTDFLVLRKPFTPKEELRAIVLALPTS